MKKDLKIFKNKRILITGHTGFKGSWLSLWLKNLGADVMGISKNVPTKPSHFELINLENKIKNKFVDITNLKKLKKIFTNFKPDYVFHLAAQSLVKKSYKEPLLTFNSNTIGTLNIMECLKELKNNCIAVIITSDKSYKNLEIKRGYKEDDVLGGFDPYSSSKASAELIIQTYYKSYLAKKKNIRIGIARAGNVIGGGDWSEDRLIPDCMKSWAQNKKVLIRSPNSTRPWQHVLDALYGYITLSIYLKKNSKLNGHAFNFGPSLNSNYKVLDVLKLAKKFWNKVFWKVIKERKKVYESNLLKLNSLKAKSILKWSCNLSFKETVYFATDWYKHFYINKKNMYDFSIKQIDLYSQKIK
tara:strand:- start:1195 stop:2265 length:1071 start_codon:yes stop_codon:yes gene_type:complete